MTELEYDYNLISILSSNCKLLQRRGRSRSNEHAALSLANGKLNDQLTYLCSLGYQASGSLVTTCTANNAASGLWNTPTGSCSCVFFYR